ncbi:MAG: TRAP transporter small permease [Rubrimonas sp.]
MLSGLAALARAFGVVARIALWIAGTCLVLMTAFVAWQVFARYVLGQPQTWTEPLAVLLMGWFIFLGAAVGTRDGYHLSFDVLLSVLPLRVGAVFQTISDVVVGCFGAGMVWFGGELMVGTWGAPMPTLGLPTGFALVPVVLGGVMVTLFSIERVLRRAAGLHTARFGDEHPSDEQPAEG